MDDRRWTRRAAVTGVRVVLLCCAVALSPTPASAQSSQLETSVPRVVFEAAGQPAPRPSLQMPAAWRVVIDIADAAATDEWIAAYDAAAGELPGWLTLRAGALDAGAVPAIAERVRALVETRPALRVVELDVAAVADPRVADYLTRQTAVAVKAVRDDVAVARGVASAAAVVQLDEGGLAPLLDLVTVASTDALAAIEAAIGERSLDLGTAVLGLAPGTDAQALAAHEIARLGGPPLVAGYVLPADAARAAVMVGAVRTLARAIGQAVTPIDADLRITGEAGDLTRAWQPRVLFGTESLATYVALDVPPGTPLTATLRLVLPVPGTAALFEPATGRERPLAVLRDEEAQASSVAVVLPAAGRWLIDMNREADASFVQREDVTAARRLTVEEILARHQLRQAATRRAVPRYIADGTMQQYFRPTVTDPGFDVFTENRYFAEGDRVEWEELSFSVNGAKWGADRPPFPLLQPEKVLAPPLVIELDQRYRYRLDGTARVEGRECYVVRFDPTDSAASLYRGTVWIDTQSFARVKQQVVQTNLVAPVVSNDETQTFAPVALPDGGEVLLPSESYTQQLVLIAGRNLLVERRMTFSKYEVNPADFEARRRGARQGDRIMYVDTDAGVRYFVKEGDERVVSEQRTTRAKAQAFGVTIDPSYDFPLPILGINYLNFEFLGRKDTQLALLFGGVLAAGNVQRPQIIGRRIDLNVDFFAIAAPGSDRFYDPDGEQEEARLLTWPLSTGVNLGFQATSYQKLTAQYQFRFDGFVRDRTTADDYVTPSSTVTNGLGLLYEYRRGGYNVTASGVLSRRASWRTWGPSAAPERSSPDYEKYALNATKTFYFGPFSKFVVNGAWFTGRRLDRFSRYQFGLFDETRLRGVPSSGVRYGELAMARGQYSFNVFEQYRLDLFLDRAWGRTREIDVPWEGLTGIGAAVNVRIPGRNLILRADIGKSFLPDRYRRLGSTVVQILFLRPLK